jgi:hypothetical protein
MTVGPVRDPQQRLESAGVLSYPVGAIAGGHHDAASSYRDELAIRERDPRESFTGRERAVLAPVLQRVRASRAVNQASQP